MHVQDSAAAHDATSVKVLIAEARAAGVELSLQLTRNRPLPWELIAKQWLTVVVRRGSRNDALASQISDRRIEVREELEHEAWLKLRRKFTATGDRALGAEAIADTFSPVERDRLEFWKDRFTPLPAEDQPAHVRRPRRRA